jgi:hypothetical protein
MTAVPTGQLAHPRDALRAALGDHIGGAKYRPRSVCPGTDPDAADLIHLVGVLLLKSTDFAAVRAR